ncbi:MULTISPECIES: ATP-grasp fold amidoligase family protein [Shimia]|uniref:ATP-grasp fold amidoligase family protein n=1 Tax=Shimia TaxID=573139 RepID=UPI001FB1F82A|nr:MULTISPECIES: ATP-grasp fold amidoligase family protein [Shimia]MDV4146048.1 ATP-grasp fold amidoligase family protein [Shimia sp. FJ5]
MTPECRAFLERIGTRRQQAEKRAKWMPRADQHRYIYEQSFENEIEAVAFFLAESLGRLPDFANPTAYSEHLRAQFLTHPNPLMAIAADKIAMREYCDLFDLPIRPLRLFEVFDDPDDLVPDDLPQNAMIKIADGCKMNLLHGPGMPVTRFAYRRFLRQFWHVDHWRRHAELHYRDIPKRILVEEALLPAETIKDPCIFCVMGEPYIILDETHRTALKDGLRPLETLNGKYFSAPRSAFGTDAEVDAMIQTARLLSQNFYHCRIDFMRNGDRLALCEITLSPGGYYHMLDTPEHERVRTALLDPSRMPEFVERGRKIAQELGYSTETSFGHFTGDPRLSTGGQ